MPNPSEHQAIQKVASRLAELLEQEPAHVSESGSADARIEFAGLVFLVEWKRAADVASVANGLRRLEIKAGAAVPLLAAPFIGEAGRRMCEAAEVNWLDLSGNARIVAPGLRIEIAGKTNLFKRAGRPGTVFAPKSARIARWLLIHRDESVSQQEIADATGMDRGFTSRIVRRMVEDGLVERTKDGRVHVSKPDLVLDAWAEQYVWDKHEIHKGVVAARSGIELAARLAEGVARAGVEHAFTGLAAAWQHDHFASFRLATLYLRDGVSTALLSDLGVREGERGANTWLVVPNDVGVLHGSADVDGLRCVHPIQTWLDLGGHPERAREAAEHLRHERLRWSDG